MEISIVINNYKTRGLLKQCLNGIFANPPSVDFEIIVVDNNSGDGSVELIREKFAPDYPVREIGASAGEAEKVFSGFAGGNNQTDGLFQGIKLIASEENLGHQRGNNLGIKHSSGKYILILNTDIAIMDQGIDKLYQFMEQQPQVALVGPRLKNPDGSIQFSCLRFPSAWVPIYRRTALGKLPFAKREIDKYLMTDFNHSETRPVDWILGSCELVRRSAIDQVGLMDEELFMYFGDVAWCKKFFQAGYSVYYFPETDIVHYHKRESAESGMFSKIFWIHIFDWIRYLKKYT